MSSKNNKKILFYTFLYNFTGKYGIKKYYFIFFYNKTLDN